nr:hypothetical protein [Clostridia bacterium]
MTAILLSLLLALQLSFHDALPASSVSFDVQPRQLWWGMIDPELSTWFAHIPNAPGDNTPPVLWNWSWRGILAALTNQPIVQEDDNAPHL